MSEVWQLCNWCHRKANMLDIKWMGLTLPRTSTLVMHRSGASTHHGWIRGQWCTMFLFYMCPYHAVSEAFSQRRWLSVLHLLHWSSYSVLGSTPDSFYHPSDIHWGSPGAFTYRPPILSSGHDRTEKKKHEETSTSNEVLLESDAEGRALWTWWPALVFQSVWRVVGKSCAMWEINSASISRHHVRNQKDVLQHHGSTKPRSLFLFTMHVHYVHKKLFRDSFFIEHLLGRLWNAPPELHTLSFYRELPSQHQRW